MKGVGVARMKAALSRYLARVKRGEEVVVTEHGEPIAKLVPYGARGAGAKERASLAREGLLDLGRGRIHPDLLRPSEVLDPEGRLRRMAGAEREEGW